MALKIKINKGDTVQVIAGSDKGKKGVVMHVQNKAKKSLKIKVQGVQMMTHFDKEKGRHESEGLIDYSNVKLLEKATKKAVAKSKKSK